MEYTTGLELKIKIHENYFIAKIFAYNNGRKGIKIMNEEDSSISLVCTVNISSLSFEKNEIMVKNWDDAFGVYPALLKSGLITPYTRSYPVGLNKAFVCKLNENFRKTII